MSRWLVWALLGLLIGALPAMAAEYFVATDGTDASAGTRPTEAWATLGRVNGADLLPGDTVRFRRGDTWRGTLRPKSGDASGEVTYTAYGEGPKPLLLGSLDLSSPDYWAPAGPGRWATAPPSATGQSLLATPYAPDQGVGWSLYCENGAQAEGSYSAEDGAYRLRCAASGGTSSDIQVYASPFTIRQGQALCLRFRAKATQRTILPGLALMSAGPPWTGYSPTQPGAVLEAGADWTTVERYYAPTADATDARLTFFLGKGLPADSELSIADLSLVPCDVGHVPFVDVGNIILGDEAECGVKVFEETDLLKQGEYWYDEDRCVLVMQSDENPAVRYGRIEAALREHIIDQSGVSYVTYDGLCLKYGAAHGIGGGSVHHITARNLDIGFVGGGDQYGGEGTVRFGNGIEFWGAAHDCLVEYCRLWEIYDAALTNQNLGAVVEQRDITYRRNLIWNSEYSFEYWNRPAESLTRDIVFESNTCVDAGGGWSHAQRPDPSGRQICFYDSQAQFEGLTIRDNIFAGATKNAFYAPTWTAEQRKSLVLEQNLWFQPEGEMIAFAEAKYPMAEFARYLAESGLDEGSLAADPRFVDAGARDYRLAEGSPCIDAGGPCGTLLDLAGVTVPQGAGPDIGAYEYGRG